MLPLFPAKSETFATGSLISLLKPTKSNTSPPETTINHPWLMLSLRSCIKHSFLKPSSSNLSLFPLIFPKDPNHNYSSIFKMSQSPQKKNAFALMMSKRPNPNTKSTKTTSSPSSSSSSPKKLKTLDSNSKPQINSTQITDPKPDPVLNSNKTHQDPQIPISPNGLIQVSPKNPNLEIENVPKKEEKGASVDESIVQLKKSPEKFDPKKAGYWGEGKKVPFLFLARVFDAVANESGRNANIDIVCNMLRTIIDTTPDDLVQIVYLLANRIAPAHEGLELGIGDASIIKALAEACGAKETHIKKQYKELGDLGLVAKASRSSQPLMWKPQPLTVAKVFETFRVIAKESGKDSQDKKKNHIKGLLVAATDCEPLYLIRLLQTKLRIGLGEETLLSALGHAIFYSEKHSSPPANSGSSTEEAAKIVKQVYSVLPVYDKIVPALLSGGVWNLPKTCFFSLGVPVGPMLAKPTKGVSEILDKFQNIEFTCEYKYDGERAQIHYLEDGTVQIYSRNAERNTEKFPDVVVAVSRVKKPSVTSFVLDCELVAYDREKQKILPFQILTTRARKNVVMSEIKVDVCIYAFDLLYLNGQQLLQEQLNIRRERLYESFLEEPGFFQYATAVTSNDLEEIQTFLDAAVDASCEGLIIKTLTRDATYEPAKRSNNWLKLKKDYMDSIGDSLDLVPIGAFQGKGKRVGGYGAFLLACYDYDKDEYQTICKTGTGFSDQVLEERSNSLRAKVIPSPKSYYRCGSINPDVWFEASEVWEVKAADLTISPVYCAAIGAVDPNKGISLRFPRLLRVRDDKGPEEATSSEMVAEMYNAQKHTQSSNKNDDDE